MVRFSAKAAFYVGKQTLMGISKHGDSYLRTLLIHGGRSVVKVAHKHQDVRNRWIGNIKRRRGENISQVAVANNNARIAWALQSRKENYHIIEATGSLRKA